MTQLKDKKICLALGFFDCIHYGHRLIIQRLKQRAAETGAVPVVSTFKNNPFPSFNSDRKLIYLFEERKSLLNDEGIEDILSFEFNKEFRTTNPVDFLDRLTDGLNVCGIVCGHDYRFGKDAKGDTALLQRYCEDRKIALDIVDEICLDGKRVSSTGIRESLLQGEIENANRLLTKPYFISGRVIRGRGEGHLYNIPTANLEVSAEKLIVKEGVYCTGIVACGKYYHSVTNVGLKPTFKDYNFSIETLIDGFDGNLYGSDVMLFFYKRIRDIKKFSDKQSLVNQIYEDLKVRC